MAFYVGQKVVCVDASPAWDGFWLPIKLNETYVIERIEHHIGGLGFILCGVRFPARNNFKADWLRSCRFRPIVSRKTDITIFEEIRDGNIAAAIFYSTLLLFVGVVVAIALS